MVKKLLSGILKKKDKEETKPSTEVAAAPQEDVPEELPPLAEDVAEKAEQPKEPVAAETPAVADKPKETGTPASISDLEGGEPPADLPSLGEGGDEKSAELPDAIKKAKAAKVKTGDVKPEETIEKKPEVKKLDVEEPAPQKPSISSPSETGFFSSVLNHLNKHEGTKEKLLSGDLFSRMSNYWELKKHEVKTGTSMPPEHQLEEELKKKLEELKTLEQKWQVQKLALEEDLKFIHQREMEIQNKVQELKRLSNELNLYVNVKPSDYFHLNNGVVLKSLHDLIDVLEIIDQDTFKHHVSKDKNDFSEWIKNSIKDNNLSEKLRKAKTKEDMIEILETEPVVIKSISSRLRKQLPPRKYLWLSNGVVIKSLSELSDAIKAMDNELFKNHVNEEKNDFAKWVRATLRNEELAKKLDKVRSKNDMANILDIYL